MILDDYEIETEDAKVERWRRKVLVDAGYPGETAIELANDPRVDLHQAVQLLERGCPPHTAARILR